MATGESDKKSRNKKILFGCSGCLVLVILSCCCFGGVFVSQDELDYNDPGEIIGAGPIYDLGSISDDYVWYKGDAEIRVYINLGASAQPGTTIEGTMSCAGPEFFVRTALVPTEGVPPGWVWVNPDNLAPSPTNGPYSCVGSLSVNPPPSEVPQMVITVRQTQMQSLAYELDFL